MSRCKCTTAKGTQCSRNASSGSNYCFQHQNCANIFHGTGPGTGTGPVTGTGKATGKGSRVVLPPAISSVTITKGSTPRMSTSSTSSTSSTLSTARPKSPARPKLTARPKSPKVTQSHVKKMDTPTSQEIAEINKVIKHINRLVETHEIEDLYVDLPAMRPFQLTMADVDMINKNPKIKYYVIEPQMWDELKEFEGDTEDFYDLDGKAVTGSGSDLWVLYKKGLLDVLKAIEKRYESIPSKNVATRRAMMGSEIYSKAAFLLNDPEGRRARAIAATKKGYPTNLEAKSGLCTDPLSDMYRHELLEIAQDLDLAFPNNVTKAELCEMISRYAEESDIDVPERVEAQEAEKMLKKAKGVTDNEAAHNLRRFQTISWSMGDKPEDAYEFIQDGDSSIFDEFPEHIIEKNNNVLDNGQLDLVISNNDIIIDWINPNGDDEELKVSGPVTYRKVLAAIDKSLQKFAKDNNVDLGDILQGHIYWEGFKPVKGKPGHYEASF